MSKTPDPVFDRIAACFRNAGVSEATISQAEDGYRGVGKPLVAGNVEARTIIIVGSKDEAPGRVEFSIDYALAVCNDMAAIATSLKANPNSRKDG